MPCEALASAHQSHHVPGTAVELADIGKDAAYRIRIFRRAKPSDEELPNTDAGRARFTAPGLRHELVLEGVLRTGQRKAAVIKVRDPLEGWSFDFLKKEIGTFTPVTIFYSERRLTDRAQPSILTARLKPLHRSALNSASPIIRKRSWPANHLHNQLKRI